MTVAELERETAVDVRLAALADKLDGVHISLTRDLSELKGQVSQQDQRVSKAELRLAQLQGAGAALTLGLPFIAVVLQKVLSG